MKYEEWYNDAKSVVANYLRNMRTIRFEDIHDLASDATLRTTEYFTRHPDKLDHKNKPKYIFILHAVRCAGDLIEKRNTREQLVRVDNVEPDEVCEGDEATLQIEVDLRRAFAELTPRQRAVMHHRVMEGRTQAETGRMLRVSPVTVAFHEKRARAKLRKLLADYGEHREGHARAYRTSTAKYVASQQPGAQADCGFESDAEHRVLEDPLPDPPHSPPQENGTDT